MVHVGWGTDHHGARNCSHGEYDTALYFTVTLGVPVYTSFRGCVHVIEPRSVRPAARLDVIRSFLKTYLGWSEAQVAQLPSPLYLSLKPSRALKRMAWLESFLWIAGILGGTGLFVTAAIAQQPVNPFRLENLLFLLPFWVVGAAFVPAFCCYWTLRKPSPRQARIRGVVAGWFGPSSDLADWPPALVGRIAPALGVAAERPDELLAIAEQRATLGEVVEALLIARMALALLDVKREPVLGARAEEVTDNCLNHLEKGLPQAG
jgi:hypothetical protein